MTEKNQQNKTKKKFGTYQIISLIVLILILGLTIAATVVFVKAVGFKSLFGGTGGREKIQAYIEQFGSWSKYVYIVIVFVSVILAFIPNNVVGIAGGYLYGIWPSVGLTLVGVVLGSLAVFGISRAFGRPLVYQMADKESIEKIEKKLENKNSLLFILFMLIPFIPSDAVCYAAGLTKMKFRQYCFLIILTRIPGTIGSAYMGGGNVEWWVWVIFFVVLFVLLGLGIVFGRKIAKHLRKNKVWAPIADTFEGLSEVGETINFGKKNDKNVKQALSEDSPREDEKQILSQDNQAKDEKDVLLEDNKPKDEKNDTNE